MKCPFTWPLAGRFMAGSVLCTTFHAQTRVTVGWGDEIDPVKRLLHGPGG